MEKAIIDSIINKYQYKIRIPKYNSININGTETKDLYTAQVCCLPGYYPTYMPGDIVWIDYEGGHIEKPVILGLLYTQNVSNNNVGVSCHKLTVDDICILPENTTIGEISKEKLLAIKELIYNLIDSKSGGKK